MSCHEFVLSLRVEFRCASDLEDEECSVSKAPEVVVTRKTHWECVESSEGFLLRISGSPRFCSAEASFVQLWPALTAGDLNLFGSRRE